MHRSILPVPKKQKERRCWPGTYWPPPSVDRRRPSFSGAQETPSGGWTRQKRPAPPLAPDSASASAPNNEFKSKQSRNKEKFSNRAITQQSSYLLTNLFVNTAFKNSRFFSSSCSCGCRFLGKTSKFPCAFE